MLSPNMVVLPIATEVAVVEDLMIDQVTNWARGVMLLGDVDPQGCPTFGGIPKVEIDGRLIIAEGTNHTRRVLERAPRKSSWSSRISWLL
jgi:hypothetical protein